MSSNHTGSVFDRYSRSKKESKDNVVNGEASPDGVSHLHAVPPSDADTDGKQPYQAVFLDKSKSQSRVRLHYGDGVKVRLLSYAYLIEVIATSHQRLSLIFTNSIFTLEGRNLDGLLEEFQDEKVRSLVCFHPGRFEDTADNAACITKIVDESAYKLVKGE